MTSGQTFRSIRDLAVCKVRSYLRYEVKYEVQMISRRKKILFFAANEIISKSRLVIKCHFVASVYNEEVDRRRFLLLLMNKFVARKKKEKENLSLFYKLME
jgi:hypothetical protein